MTSCGPCAVGYRDKLWMLSKVVFIEECWIWVGAKKAAGYGQFVVKSRGTQKSYLAHRYMKMLI